MRDALGKKRRLGDFFHKVWKRPKEEKTKKQKQEEGMIEAQERGANVCVRDKGRSIYLPCRPSSSNQKQRTTFCDEVLALPSRVERASKRERERARLLLHRHPA